MQKLVDGIHTFQRGFFKRNRKLFERLANSNQHPEALFITCSDSRVVPNLITNASPGDLFIVRNVGNLIPHPDLPGGTAAAIEYAVEVLEVPSIIVCGHTQCGAMEAILNPQRVDNLPYVRRWLEHTQRVRDILAEKYSHLEGEARLNAAVEENVLIQLERLRAFPFIAKRLDAGKLHIGGWVFDIRNGTVFDYDPDAEQYAPLSER